MKSPKFSGRPRKPKLLLIRRVHGDSMLPALRPGRIVVVWVCRRRLSPGDVVMFRHDGLEKVKRIQDVRDDSVYVVGDNKEQSTDSRSFGWLHKTAVTGKVIWPRDNRRI